MKSNFYFTGILFLLIIFFSFFGVVKSSEAAPAISSVSGSVSHGENITISGSDFGIKNPAKPLMWDDAEDATVNTFPSSSPNSYSRVGYSDYQPGDWRGDEDIPDEDEINYREFPHTHVSTSKTAPYANNTKFLSGAHYEDDINDNVNHSGRDVSLTVATPLVSVSSMTRSGTTVSVTTVTPHNFVNGDLIHLEGADQAEYNTSGGTSESDVGPWDVTVINDNQFTFEITTTPATPATGTIGVALFSDRWFASFYYSVNDEWPTCNDGEAANHKETILNGGDKAYGNTPYTNRYLYSVLWSSNNNLMPCNRSGQTGLIMQSISPAFGGTDNGFPDNTPPWHDWWSHDNSNAVVNTSPYGDWVKMEQLVSNDQGFIYFYQDNHMLWGGSSSPYFMTNGTYGLGWRGIRSFTVGGYYREDLNGNGTGYQNSDAMRYFDDIYIDSTLSRVMLTNNATYENATIVEPQIPSAWASGEITVKVNQGAIPDGTAYLFAFDADGNMSDGYQVAIGGDPDTTPPSHPTGLSVE